MGCILAGVYTSEALEQLRSSGFGILYFTYESVVAAFKGVGVDARFDQGTADSEFRKKMKQWKAVPTRRHREVWNTLIELNAPSVKDFMAHLERAVKRIITAVRVIPLHGSARDCVTIDEAIAFVDSYRESAPIGPLVKYEVVVRYDNGDKIEASLETRLPQWSFSWLTKRAIGSQPLKTTVGMWNSECSAAFEPTSWAVAKPDPLQAGHAVRTRSRLKAGKETELPVV